ncbi:MAG: YdeI/OmpD-associated family protein [Bacteroidales bacterium]|nr:YdeI/OmpD-associated family protein [Bacteroidales bacterium]
MEVTNLLDIRTRHDLRMWYLDNHEKENLFWIRVNRSGKEIPGVVMYLDAVEEALCFGWIDSTLKKIDASYPVQRFTPRRKGGLWTELNKERCRRLIRLGLMTPAGEKILPDMDPDHFVIEEWVLDALKKDDEVWKNFCTFPDAYKRIKLYHIQRYNEDGFHDSALAKLEKFISFTRKGKMIPGWNDYGRLE